MNFYVVYLKVLPAFLTALIISLIAMPAIIQVAALKNLIDAPDEVRKKHDGIIPTLGGIGIFSAFLIAFSIWGNASSLESYPFFVASLFMLFLIGIKDDILIISPIKKLGVQVLASLEIVIGGHVVLRNLGGIFGLHEIPLVAGVILTVIIFIVLINSYNLIDGIDGLAGGIGIIISTVLGVWFLFSGFLTMSILAFVLAGALIGFLIYNFHPAKIFMGDTGAMAVGFIIVYMVIQFIQLNQAHPESNYYINNAPIFALSLLILPVIDTLRVFMLRVIAGNNPLVGDYNHVHHQFIKKGMKPDMASFFLWLWNVSIVFLAYYFDFLEPNLLGVLILFAGFAILPVTELIHFVLNRYSPNSLTLFFPQANKEKPKK